MNKLRAALGRLGATCAGGGAITPSPTTTILGTPTPSEAAELAAEVKRIQAERADYSWVPSGFYKFSMNNNMAWKKIGYDAADCYSNCLGLQVVSRDYCSSMRIEANFTRNGAIVDSSSDYASNIPAGTPTVMKLVTSVDGTSTDFTEAKCT